MIKKVVGVLSGIGVLAVVPYVISNAETTCGTAVGSILSATPFVLGLFWATSIDGSAEAKRKSEIFTRKVKHNVEVMGMTANEAVAAAKRV